MIPNILKIPYIIFSHSTSKERDSYTNQWKWKKCVLLCWELTQNCWLKIWQKWWHGFDSEIGGLTPQKLWCEEKKSWHDFEDNVSSVLCILTWNRGRVCANLDTICRNLCTIQSFILHVLSRVSREKLVMSLWWEVLFGWETFVNALGEWNYWVSCSWEDIGKIVEIRFCFYRTY